MAESFVFLAICLICVALNGALTVKLTVKDICKLVPVNTRILVPGSCADWAECGYDGEVIDEGSCLQGWLFDRNTAKCNRSSKVVCSFSNTMNTPCALAKNGTFLPQPKNCQGFIFCNDGKEQYSVCPSGLNFNPETQSCVYPSEYECPEEEEDDALNDICKSVADNIRMADPNSCSSFKVCVKGLLKTTNCIAGTYFSRETKKCGDWEESDCLIEEEAKPTEEPSSMVCGTNENPIVGFVSDGRTCSGYFYCDEKENGKPDRNPQFSKCTDGKFFDANLSSCKDRANVRCLYDRCEGMGNKFANRQGDCSKYTYCSGGVSTSEGSCPENFFFDEKIQSCTKKDITYMACAE